MTTRQKTRQKARHAAAGDIDRKTRFYDARVRAALRRVAALLRLPWAAAANLESAVGAQMLAMRRALPLAGPCPADGATGEARAPLFSTAAIDIYCCC